MFYSSLALLCTIAFSSAYVTELTDDNFYNYAQDKEVLLVDFYAPWCSDCKKLEPEFERAASNLGTRSIDLVKVDCFGAGKGLCQMYGVKSWPQLKNFHKGTYTGDYSGLQSAEALSGYITTVENSVLPQAASNPYAMAVPGGNPSYPSPKAMALPVVGAISCAKCNVNKPKASSGKIHQHCSDNVKRACIEQKQKQEVSPALDDDDRRRTIH